MNVMRSVAIEAIPGESELLFPDVLNDQPYLTPSEQIRIKWVHIPLVASGRAQRTSIVVPPHLQKDLMSAQDLHSKFIVRALAQSTYTIVTPPLLLEEPISAKEVLAKIIIRESSRARARNMNRFRSVCNTGIISTLIFGGCIGYLTNIDYIAFEVGVPVLGGLIAILIGFLNGLRRK